MNQNIGSGEKVLNSDVFRHGRTRHIINYWMSTIYKKIIDRRKIGDKIGDGRLYYKQNKSKQPPL